LNEYLKTPRPVLIIALLDVLTQKSENKCSEEFENIISSFLSSNSYKTDFKNFIDKALKDSRGIACSSPVGFLDEKIMKFIETKKINFHGSRIIILESSFIGNRINALDNRLTEEDWHKILDYFKVSDVLWNSKSNRLIYLSKYYTNRFLKMSVTIMDNPTIDEISVFNVSPSNCIDDPYAYKQVLEMESIR